VNRFLFTGGARWTEVFIVNKDALQNDTILAAVVDGAHGWSGGGTWTLTTFNNVKTGVAFPGLFASTSSSFREPNHGHPLILPWPTPLEPELLLRCSKDLLIFQSLRLYFACATSIRVATL
jgi:hypothetical protein